jgi:zinc knuckle protein
MVGPGRNATNHTDEPDLATVIAQAVANAIPTIVAQVTSSLQRSNETREARVNMGNEEVLSKASLKRKEIGESSGVKKMGRFDPNDTNRGRVMAAVKPARRPYGGPHPLCNRCNQHHSSSTQYGTCDNCNRRGHLARNCRAPRTGPMNVAPTQTIPPQGNQRRGECFECGSRDHYRNNCPRWVGQQVQVAVHPN